MSTDPTEHAPPIEPTTPAIYNHYDINPYASASLPPLPPPPPKQRRYRGWIIALLVTVCAVVGFNVLLYISLHASPYQGNVTPVKPTATVAPTPTAQTAPTCITGCGGGGVDPNYTATEIVSDFVAAGCPCPTGITYGTTIWEYSNNNYYVTVHAASSATWIDKVVVGLWVYGSPDDALSAYTQVGDDETSPNPQATPIPSTLTPAEFVHGRCLFLGGLSAYHVGGPWMGYEQVLDQYCI